MAGGVFDPFSKISDGGDSESPSIVHIGKVASYIPSTNSVMVMVPTINTSSAIGPCKVMRPYAQPPTSLPQKGQKVVVALIDGSLNSAIVLGFL
jgi:hypothetical protein